jgi:thymidylate synthase
MFVINATNIRDALPLAVKYVKRFGEIELTRNGRAIVSPKPVTIRYRYPKHHVLVNAVRDANPFFHLMEAMWMLAGRNDGEFLDYYIKDFSKKFGNQNGIITDAYGYRWRQQFGHDQLLEIIQQLKQDLTTRQAVLQMWDDDLQAKGPKPCNLVATFRIRKDKLDMTVFNRSNDLIWGCCGANAVHFPILQEYIASMVGVKMGEYWQVTTNLHLYQEHIEMLGNCIELGKDLHVALKDLGDYEGTVPLITHPECFDEELGDIMQMIEDVNKDLEVYDGNIANLFLCKVVLPMAQAHRLYKKKDPEPALIKMERVIAADWKRAGIEWIKRRVHDKSVRNIQVEIPSGMR